MKKLLNVSMYNEETGKIKVESKEFTINKKTAYVDFITIDGIEKRYTMSKNDFNWLKESGRIEDGNVISFGNINSISEVEYLN